MSLIHLETKSSTVKLEIHESRLPRALLLQPPTSIAGCQLDGWITDCSETCRWVSNLTSLGLEYWELAAAALHHLIYFSFREIPKSSPALPATHCSMVESHRTLPFGPFPASIEQPSSLYRVSPLFIHRVSKCDFLNLALTVHIHWALLNIRAEKYLYFLLLFLPFPNAPSETSILLSTQGHNRILGKLEGAWAEITAHPRLASHLSALLQLLPSTRGSLSHHIHILPRSLCPSLPSLEAWEGGSLHPSLSTTGSLPGESRGAEPTLGLSGPRAISCCCCFPAHQQVLQEALISPALWAFLYCPSFQCQKSSSTLHVSRGRTWHQAQVRKTCSSAARDSDKSHLPQAGLEEAVWHWVAQDRVLHAFQVENNQQEYEGCSSACRQWTRDTYQG